jgi:uncharacterized protein (TIGR03437 family)
MKTKITLLVVLLLGACAWQSSAQPAFDSSGDNQLNGTYYMRQVIYFQDSSAVAIDQAISIEGTITFSGNGTYTLNNVSLLNSATGSSTGVSLPNATGTYVISASGQGYLSAIDPSYSNDTIYGMVSNHIFIGSSTENIEGYNDLMIAAPVASPVATNATLSGTYTVAYMNPAFSTSTAAGGDAVFTMTANGAGNIGNISVTGYIGSSSTASTESLSGVTYNFQNGGAQLAFGGSSTSLINGTEVLYISPDGNFVFGGSVNGFDIFAGVRSATSNPTNYQALYYQAGLDMAVVNNGGVDSYYGATNVLAQNNIIAHQRFNNGGGVLDETYADGYTLNGNGSSADSFYNYWSSSNGAVRIGYGAGPYLGINISLQAPSLSGTGVYLNPQGVVNAASSAPFTAQLSPGEFLTLYGTNLAPSTQSAGVPFPTTLNEVQVMINEIPAPIYFVSASQIQVIVPYITSPTSVAQIQVINNKTNSNIVTQFTGATSVGVFGSNPANRQADSIGEAAALHPDYSLVTDSSPAAVGETIAVYLAGMGAVSGNPADGGAAPSSPLDTTSVTPQVYLFDLDGSGNQAQATVTFSGLAPGFAGLYQINFTIPSGLDGGDEALEIYSGSDSDTDEVLLPVVKTASADRPAERAKQRRFIHHQRGPARQLRVSANSQ